MEIEELVVAAQGGDEKAYEEIVERFQKMAVSYAFSKLGNFEEAQDVAQEAFLKAYCALLSLRDPKAFPGWFRRIVETQTLSVTRRNQVLMVPLQDEMAPPVAPSQGRKLQKREVRRRVNDSLATLPDREAKIVRLYYLDELSLREVAKRLGCSVAKAKSRLHAARFRLRRHAVCRVMKAQFQRRDSRLSEMATREAVETIDRKLQTLDFSIREQIEEAADLICAKGRLLRFLGEMAAAVDLYEQALEQVSFQHDAALKTRLRLERGLSRMDGGDYDRAFFDFRHCQRTFSQDSRWRLAVDLAMAALAWRRGNLAVAARYNRAAARRAKEEGRVHGYSPAINNQALIAWRRGRLAEALDGFQEALRLVRKVRDRYAQAFIQMNMGLIKCVQGRFQESKRLHARARKLAEELEFWPLLGAIRCNLADISLRQQRYDEALEHAQAGVELSRQTWNRRNEAISLENIALASAYLDRFNDAQRAVVESEAIGTQLGDLEQLLSLELVKAEVLLPEGRFTDALEVLRSAEKMLKKQGSMVEMPRLLRVKAGAQLGLGLFDDAMRSIEEGRKMCAEQGSGAEDRALARLEKKAERHLRNRDSLPKEG